MRSFFSNRIFVRTVFIVILLSAPVITQASERSQNSPGVLSTRITSPAIHILASDETGIRFEFDTSPFSVAEDGSIQVDGLERTMNDVGSPALPYYSAFIAVPPNAEVSVRVNETGLTTHHSLDVPPVPKEQLLGEESVDNVIFAYSPGSIREQSPENIENPSIYGADNEFPGAAYSVSKPMYRRDLRMVELRLFPLQYNPYRRIMIQSAKLSVEINFSGSNLEDLRPSASNQEAQETVWREQIINYDQASAWRTLPQYTAAVDDVELPIGTKTYKVEVDQDGIYEIPGSDLAEKGMVLPVDPATIQMMQGGKPVAFQFIDSDNNKNFDAIDKIRFYGWAYDGSRSDKNFVGNNIFWLWTGGTASQLTLVNNEVGTGTTVTSFRDSITERQERHYASAWSVEWDVNDPTSWHTRRVTIEPDGVEHVEAIDLPNPDPSGGDVSFDVELTTHLRRPLSGISTTSFAVETFLNDSTPNGDSTWIGPKNVNVTQSVSGTMLKQPGDADYPSNQVKVRLDSNSPNPIEMNVTQFTVEYTRQLVAVGDQLIFGRQASGPSSFEVSGFSNGDPNKALVWDISDRHQPKQIMMQSENIIGDGADNSYLLGRDHTPNASFIATTNDNILPVKAMSDYVPVAIDPTSGGARWLAIAHSSLRGAADELALYRQPQMEAYVVNIEDVVNQIGYGFHTPETIRQYLRHAINDWATAPDYVTLFGDATNNPRNLDCVDCGAGWQKDTPTFIVTDLKFIDRWQGMVPSDFAISLLFGDDLIPDIAIARMPAATNLEATYMVNKVIIHETQRKDSFQDWQKNVLFVADNLDSGGNFCSENVDVGTFIPDTYNQTHLCLETPTTENINELRANMRTQINDIGTAILNYRGHGSTTTWAGYNDEPPILSTADTDFWQNSDRSVVVLSADCLDGYFILNNRSALGETFVEFDNRGSVAHWSSAGLGYVSEHSILHKGFYDGIFKYKQNVLGDAVNHAKIDYYQAGKHPSELFSFILLGDAAMAVVPDEQSIGDRVWHDVTEDGVQDASEFGLINATITLKDFEGVVVDTTTTDFYGGYLFENIDPGTYTVEVTSLPPELVDSNPAPTYDEDSGTTNPDSKSVVVLAAGQDYRTADFGYRFDSPTAVGIADFSVTDDGWGLLGASLVITLLLSLLMWGYFHAHTSR